MFLTFLFTTTAEIPLWSLCYQIKVTHWRIRVFYFISFFSSPITGALPPLHLKTYFTFVTHQRNIFYRLGGQKMKTCTAAGGRGPAPSLLWTWTQLNLNWVLEWKEVVELSFFHPVSQRQTCFVTHILADLEASRPSDPVRREERAGPGSLFHQLLSISHSVRGL